MELKKVIEKEKEKLEHEKLLVVDNLYSILHKEIEDIKDATDEELDSLFSFEGHFVK